MHSDNGQNQRSTVERPWSLPVESVAAELATDLAGGLSSEEAQHRLAAYGPNALRQAPAPSWLETLLAQFLDWMIGLLAVAALVSAVNGEWGDSLLIAAILVINAIIGFSQERRAERAVAALRRLAQPVSRVWRAGALVDLPVTAVVPGDIVEVQAGTLVPADGRIVGGADLQADEAPLTGESLPVDKDSQPCAADTLLPDRTSMAYAGTAIARGRGRLLVTATGMATELGRIASLLETTKVSPTALQRRLARLSKELGVVVVLISAVIFATGVFRGNPIDQMLLVAISLAVAAIPEGLPAVITITLALGSQRMSRRKAIVRQLSSVEALGSVSVICSDKTGTLTQNKMSVREIVPHADDAALREELLRAAALCNDAQFTNGQWSGSATEVAIAQSAQREGTDVASLHREFPRIAEFPFNSQRKRMSTLHRAPDGDVTVYVKGAPEGILRRSVALATPAGAIPLAEADRARLEQSLGDLAALGRRVVGVARRPWKSEPARHPDAVERDLEFLGFLAILDPPRPEAREAILRCRSAGIMPVMITGDHQNTATAIGSELELYRQGDGVIDGRELASLEDSELVRRAAQTTIYARVSPEHKLRIVRAHQAQGASVAMTGDGVNDAPALKQADIGVAMGITGTDVSKEVARIILADDNFATIVAAIEEGRSVYDNIRKCVRYLLTSNASEIAVIFAAIVAGWPLPLLPVHLLWINLVTDGLPALAFAYERLEPDTMRRPPRPRDESIFARGLARNIVWYGLVMALAALCVYWYFHAPAADEASQRAAVTYSRTATFFTLSVMQLLYVLSLRSSTKSVVRDPPWRNWRLLAASVAGIVLQFAIVYLEPVQPIFHTTALKPHDMAICLAAAVVPFALVELGKLTRSFRKYRAG